jgi:hypothetical protein
MIPAQWPSLHATSTATSSVSTPPGELREDIDEIYEQASDTAARTTLFQGAPADVLDRDTIRARHALFFLEQMQPDRALALLTDHTFKPWEGGVVVHNILSEPI